jgi:mannose-6-phosphate isomerase-like protein (cupin superfamily)
MPDAINLEAKLSSFSDFWGPRCIAQFNGHDVMVVKVQGEFVWHKHDETDDFFLVLSGQLTIKLRDRDVVVRPGELFIVPRGVEHAEHRRPGHRRTAADRMTTRVTSKPATGSPAIPAAHLVIRFVLELAVLAGFAIWGWYVGSGGILGAVLALLFVALAAAVWAIFRVPNDPGGGRPVVAVPGWARLLLELAIFALSAYGIWTSWSRAAAETLLTALALHYAVTWERTRWLLRGDVGQE